MVSVAQGEVRAALRMFSDAFQPVARALSLLHMDVPDQPHVFPARIQKIWILRCIDVPRDVSKAIRKVAGEGVSHISVHGWIEGLPFTSTLVPRRMLERAARRKKARPATKKQRH